MPHLGAVIPAKAGIQWSAALDTGFRRYDDVLLYQPYRFRRGLT